jgi:hypothetical protein
MQIVLMIGGVVLALLGGMWMLEGFGILAGAPVSLGGPSILGGILGLLAIVAGGSLIAMSRGRRPPA